MLIVHQMINALLQKWFTNLIELKIQGFQKKEKKTRLRHLKIIDRSFKYLKNTFI